MKNKIRHAYGECFELLKDKINPRTGWILGYPPLDEDYETFLGDIMEIESQDYYDTNARVEVTMRVRPLELQPNKKACKLKRRLKCLELVNEVLLENRLRPHLYEWFKDNALRLQRINDIRVVKLLSKIWRNGGMKLLVNENETIKEGSIVCRVEDSNGLKFLATYEIVSITKTGKDDK